MPALDTAKLRPGERVVLDTDLRDVGLHGAADAGHLTKVRSSTADDEDDVYLFKVVSSTIDEDGYCLTVRPFGREMTFRVPAVAMRRAAR